MPMAAALIGNTLKLIRVLPNSGTTSHRLEICLATICSLDIEINPHRRSKKNVYPSAAWSDSQRCRSV